VKGLRGKRRGGLKRSMRWGGEMKGEEKEKVGK
jgi:hypothetical protein